MTADAPACWSSFARWSFWASPTDGMPAPAVPTGEVQLWGVDLKRGIELAMGKALFSCMATTPAQAVEVLKRLLQVIDERGTRMAGVVREHTPRPGDPLHVLVIDVLSVLTSYGPPEVVKKADQYVSNDGRPRQRRSP